MREGGADIAWFVSNCQSRSGREKLVQQIKTEMAVDVYGACGKAKLFLSQKLQDIHEVLGKTSKCTEALLENEKKRINERRAEMNLTI